MLLAATSTSTRLCSHYGLNSGHDLIVQQSIRDDHTTVLIQFPAA
jgi:hypothetical protein